MTIAFDAADAIGVLRRTPATLSALLGELSDEWILADEGDGTFSPRDVVAHLLHGERTDWMPRLRIILEHGEGRPFDPFDRRAHEVESAGRPMAELLRDFRVERERNLADLAAMVEALDLDLEGTHPELGAVTIRQLLAAWVVHDLGHLRQVARVMARQYGAEVGPWEAYLPVLHG